MAGSRSFGVYSLDEAESYFTAALAALDSNPECASDDQVAEFLALYVRLLNLTHRIKFVIDVVGRYLTRVDRIGNDLKAVLIRTYCWALIHNGRYREAVAVQQSSETADRGTALAYRLSISALISPTPLHDFEIVKQDALTLLSETTDAYFQNAVRWTIGYIELTIGRINEARNSARELMQVGQLLNDPRSTGYGLLLLSHIAVMSGSYAEGLEYSEQSLNVAITPTDKIYASLSKASALVALGRNEEGMMLLEESRRRCDTDGDVFALDQSNLLLGVCKILQGRFADGIHVIVNGIFQTEKDGYKIMADLERLFLADVYLQIMTGGDKKVPLPTLLRNLPILLKVMFTGGSRIRALIRRVLENPHFDPAGFHVGHAKMILGLLYKTRKKSAIALEYLTEARRIFSQFGQTPILARVDTALAELKQ
jgi:tetratricopeptide (TPR) repeat protein